MKKWSLNFFLLVLKNSMANKWLVFLKSWRAKHPKVSMKMAMKSAAVEWRKAKGAGGAGGAAAKSKKRGKKKK